MIRASLAAHPSTCLFVSLTHMLGMTNDAFATYFSDCFDRPMRKHITISLLRHMWVTQRVDQRRMTAGEIARKMLHSTEMQRLYFMHFRPGHEGQLVCACQLCLCFAGMGV